MEEVEPTLGNPKKVARQKREHISVNFSKRHEKGQYVVQLKETCCL